MTNDSQNAVDHPTNNESVVSDKTKNTIIAAVDTAEKVPDPLEGLVERVADHPGAAFKPDVLKELTTFKKEDRAEFEALRTQLKKKGCRVLELDKAIGEEYGERERNPTQADILIDLAAAAQLFHTAELTAFADIQIEEHRETWPVRSQGFKRWLVQQYFEATDGAPGSEAMQSALNVIEAKAHYRAPEREVFIRVANYDERIYIDLVDKDCRAIEIVANGWRIINKPPVRFRRAAGMLPLPEPEKGGSILALQSFLNLKSDQDFMLAVAWALAVLRGIGPYPVLAVTGEQGSAKSTFVGMFRALVDPNTAPLRALPRKDHDLYIAATNSHVLAFDNISRMPAWLSDALCRLSTGGGFATRQLYTDQDEILFNDTKPSILNGIDEFITRPDLADRTILINLEAIPEEKRRPAKEIWAAFDVEHPKILGAFLDAMVMGLKMLSDTKLPSLPRMADFALWSVACETAYVSSGKFMEAFDSSRNEIIANVVESDPVGSAIRIFMNTDTSWTGTATELLEKLSVQEGERVCKAKSWPSTPQVLSRQLRRLAPFLRKLGIRIEKDRMGHSRDRMITLSTKSDNGRDSSSDASAAGQLAMHTGMADDADAIIPFHTS